MSENTKKTNRIYRQSQDMDALYYLLVSGLGDLRPAACL